MALDTDEGPERRALYENSWGMIGIFLDLGLPLTLGSR